MKRVLLVAGIIGAMLLSVILAAYFGGSKREGTFDKGQRFTAKPGTTRDNAVALTSNKRPKGKDSFQDSTTLEDEDEGDSPLTIKSLSAPKDEHRSGPAYDKALEALNSSSAETGILELQKTLALPTDPEQAAVLHEAMGQLYARLDPPDFAKAEEAFVLAREATEDPELERSILLRAVQVMMQGGEDDAARRQLVDGFEHDGVSDEIQYRLLLLSGQLQERAGELSGAEKTYQEVLDRAITESERLGPETTVALARLAGLRLINLYRDQARSDDVKALTKHLKKALKKFETPV